MKNIKERLIEAQNYAMSIRPEIGGFPVIAQVLREAGVLKNFWSLPSCQSTYLFKDGAVVQQGNPLLTGTHEILKLERELLISAIRKDQRGASTFSEFLEAIWKAGVIRYDIDFIDRHVVYYGINNESYKEDYPLVEI